MATGTITTGCSTGPGRGFSSPPAWSSRSPGARWRSRRPSLACSSIPETFSTARSRGRGGPFTRRGAACAWRRSTSPIPRTTRRFRPRRSHPGKSTHRRPSSRSASGSSMGSFRERLLNGALSGLVAAACVTASLTAQDAPVSIHVDAAHGIGPMTPMWAFFGYDEPNYTYMKDGRALLSELAALSPSPVFIRTHNLLTTGDGTPALKWGSTNAYREDAAGHPIYNWRIIDSIFDNYIRRKMKPLAQIGFMPEALSTNPQPYKHSWRPGAPYKEVFTGWAYPPKDYDKWRELIYQWAKHCVERYGKKEVESWWWEVWNEPNIGYWQGTVDEYCKMYDYAADGLRKALPTARIGGCDITGGGSKFLDVFLDHCLNATNYATGKKGSPLDLILFHAKGQPKVVNGTVVMNVGTQMRNIRDAFVTVNMFGEVKNIPLVIGESDPEGCAACGMSTNPENAYRNGTMYSSYTAASFARKYLLADSL